jgi:hypothetical protein
LLLTGLKTRHYKLSFHKTAANFLGDKRGAWTREKTRTATSLSPDMNCLPHFTIALRRWFTSAADRPAGTREALPGTRALSQRWNVLKSKRLEEIYP